MKENEGKKKEGKKKKECSQLVAGKIISMQIDFSAAKTSTEITEIMLNTVELCKAPVSFTELKTLI